ncbi:hypothetical protein R3P38DRAFT_3254028 [Favolaschia claudopus]|uniref:Uncharacterized protein n=1 Tax=Favolaschia claudopus TaxID=2862362 RepID=A0AAW0DY16_9AGAR
MAELMQPSPSIPPPPPPSPVYFLNPSHPTTGHFEDNKPHEFYGPDGRIRERVAEPGGTSFPETSHNVYAPRDHGSRVHDDSSCNFWLRGIDSPLIASSSQSIMERESRPLDNPFQGDQLETGSSNALGLYLDPGVSSVRNTPMSEDCDRLTRQTFNSNEMMSTRFVSSDQLHGHCDSPFPSQSTSDAFPRTETYFDYSNQSFMMGETGAAVPQQTACILFRASASDGEILNIHPTLPNRFTSALRERMIFGFQNGNIPDFDTFKSLLYAPIVLSATSGADAATEDSPLHEFSSQQDGWSSDSASLMSETDLYASYPEDVVTSETAVDSSDTANIEKRTLDEYIRNISPLCDATVLSDEYCQDVSVVYLEDLETEDMLASRMKVSDPLAPKASRNKSKKTKDRETTNREITSFFTRVRQRRRKAALGRRLRRPPRTVPL